jgi:hypothetical protein
MKRFASNTQYKNTMTKLELFSDETCHEKIEVNGLLAPPKISPSGFA